MLDFSELLTGDQGMNIKSISEENGIKLLSDNDLSLYSIGISTGGVAEIRMAEALPSRHIIATTIDEKGALFAKDKIFQSRVADQIEVKLEDVSKPLPYSDGSFDFIYARLVLHYLSVQDLERALSELYRVLKTDGTLFAVVRSKECSEAIEGTLNPETGLTSYIAESGFIEKRCYYDKESICRFLINAGYQIIDCSSYKERLCIDFERTILSKNTDTLIEVSAKK